MGFPNTKDVEERKGFAPLPKEGWYEVTLRDDYIDGVGEKSSIPYTLINVNIDGGNRRASGFYSHSEKALFKVKELKKAIGMKDEEEELSPYIGTRFLAMLINEEYDGSTNVKIKYVRNIDQASKTKVLHLANEAGEKDLPF